MIQETLRNFLFKINQNANWLELALEIELQPAYIGISGYCITDLKEEISLRTKTDDDFDKVIKDFHINTCNDKNKWNKIKFVIKKNKEENLSLIWDEIWQTQIDRLNVEAKQKNSNYNLPKWSWE